MLQLRLGCGSDCSTHADGDGKHENKVPSFSRVTASVSFVPFVSTIGHPESAARICFIAKIFGDPHFTDVE
jgi:hypothetical protein